MELKDFIKCSVRAFFLCQIFLIFLGETNGQLDLPNMPGPPYPDPRGQNRWGVKFDPRKHGPPYDKIRGSSLKDIYQQGTRSQAPSASNSLLQLRPRRRRPFRHIERDSLRGPPRMRSRSHNRRPRRRQNRYYGNELKKKRPRPHHEEEDEDERPVYPVKPEEHKLFWNKWNSWYQSQEEAKEKLKKGKSHSHHHKESEEGPTPITYYIDAEEFEKLQDADEDEEDYGGNYLRGYGGRWKARRDYYMKKMREMYRKAKDLTIPDNGDEEKGKSEATAEGWRIFTTIGKGLDAANEAMGSVRKTIGGSILGTGMKYGGKMALNAMMNVGTSALTTALQSATPLG